MFRARCPVPERERDWIDESLEWFHAQFGEAALHGEVLTPSREFFPAHDGDTDAYVRALLERTCARMCVDPHRGSAGSVT
jgi:hypothetical protein